MLDEHAIAIEDAQIRCIDNVIKYARRLNEYGRKSVAYPLSGTDFLHGLLNEKIIDIKLYIQLIRLAEDSDMEYEIKCVPCES
jgi:hypothetical protein